MCKAKNPEVSLHVFPLKDENRCNEWLRLMNLQLKLPDDYKTIANLRICNRHFDISMQIAGVREKLNERALPGVSAKLTRASSSTMIEKNKLIKKLRRRICGLKRLILEPSSEYIFKMCMKFLTIVLKTSIEINRADGTAKE